MQRLECAINLHLWNKFRILYFKKCPSIDGFILVTFCLRSGLSSINPQNGWSLVTGLTEFGNVLALFKT